MRNIRVVAYASDSYACGHYRIVWPGEAAARAGLDVKVVAARGATGITALKLGHNVQLAEFPDCDVVVFQRPAGTFVADVIPLLQERGIAVVVDVDDDLERIHPSNPAFRGMHPRSNPNYNWANVRRACQTADLVTVSTPALLSRYAPHGRARLLPNFLPAHALRPHEPAAQGSVGWAGSLHSHPGDLDVAAGALARLHAEGHELQFVGPGDGVEAALRLPSGSAWFAGELEFEDWLPAVARMGVGVAPLAQSTFNEAKSWLKPLEYSACGVPWVGSDLPEYRRLASLCGAPIAKKQRDWYPALKSLLTDRVRAAELSQAASAAAETLVVDHHAHLWAEAWQTAADSARATARA